MRNKFAKNKTPNKGTAERDILIQNIDIRPVVRSTVDINKWRSALKAAEMLVPIRVPLYDLYADLMLDGVLKRLVAKRISGVTRTKMTFVDRAGKEVEEITNLINKKSFRTLRKERMLSLIWGISVVDFTRTFNDELKVLSVERKHIKPEKNMVVWEQMGVDGIDYSLPPYAYFMCEFGEKRDLGLLLQAAPYVIYKRGGFGDWAKFAEVFGMPFREARYDGYNNQVRKQLVQAMEQAGSASYAILPKDAEFKIHESRNTSNNGELYNTLRRACNEELCILLLGQTETTTSSSSSGYAQSLTHASVESQMNQDDLEDELCDFNEKVLPILANLGYPVDGGSFTHVIPDTQLSKKDKADVAIKFKTEAGLPISDDYFYDEFGIPKPDNYKELKEIQTPKTEDDPIPPPDPKKPEKKPKKDQNKQSSKLSLWHQLRLRLADFFDPAPKH